MLWPQRYCLFAILIVVFCTSCADAEKPIKTLSTGSLQDTFMGEQGDVLRKHGTPDKAYQKPLGVTQWVYCRDLEGSFVIEFDSAGFVLDVLKVRDERVCPHKDDRSERE